MMNGPLEDSNFIANYKKFVRKLDNLYWKKHPNWYLEFKKFDDEKFKEIDGYFELYFVSNYGQVVSFHRKLPIVRRFEFVSGFLGLDLSIMGQATFHYIHNLVYTTFLAPLQPGKKVIHQNGITTDNYYKNLETVPITPEVKFIKGKKYDFSLYYQVELESKPVVVDTVSVLQFNMGGKFIREYKSLKSASVITRIDGHQISSCMSGEKKTAGGYQWRYKRNPLFKNGPIDINPVQYLPSPRAQSILQFDLKGNFIKEYPTILEAEKHVNTNCSSISTCARGKYKTAGGYQWRYKNDPIFKKGVVKIAPARKPRRPSSKPILQFGLDGKFIKEYSSIKEAGRAMDRWDQMIGQCANGRLRIAYGFQWKYKNDPRFAHGITGIEAVTPPQNFMPTAVLQFDLKGNFIKEYDSIASAARSVGVSPYSIGLCLQGKLKTSANFQWRNKEKFEFGGAIKKIEPLNKITIRKVPVLQFDTGGKFVKEYASVLEAARKAGAPEDSIRNCLNGQYKSAGNFQWRLKTDPIFRKGIKNIPKLDKPLPKISKAVLKLDEKGKIVKEFASISEASREAGISIGRLRDCLRGKSQTAGGFYWIEKGNEKLNKGLKSIIPSRKKLTNQPKAVLQFGMDGKFIAQYPSISQAAKDCGISPSALTSCLNGDYLTAGGFQWRSKSQFNSGQEIKNIHPVPMNRKPAPKPVLQFDINGKFITRYSSITKAARILNIYRNTIRACAERKMKTADGFQWRYQDDPIFKSGIGSIEPLKKIHHSVPVIQFELSGKYIREYPSAADAAKTAGVSSGNIYSCLRRKTKTAGGYQWRYKNEPAFKKGIKNIESLEDIIKVIRKPVLQFNLKGKFIRQFSNIVEASHILNIPVNNIGRCVNGKSRFAGGYQWRSANDPMFENGIIDIGPVKSQVYPTSRPVLQYDLEGNLIREYKSINEAWEKTGITRSHIANCAYGKYKTDRASGYIWKFKKV
jgi:hypothetical protein